MNNLEIPKVPVIKSKTPSGTGITNKQNMDWFSKTFSADLTFYIHLFVYASVIGLCLMLNLMHFNGRLWTITAALGWLIGLSFHFTLYKLFEKDMLNKEEGLEASFWIHMTIFIVT
ncbi:MAG: 2TM domain-containing protein, partial [Candidatus Helarchaeota archaeon]|nr:2TM domain-containing protein [Candidatus Helarchaeota archaeon]